MICFPKFLIRDLVTESAVHLITKLAVDQKQKRHTTKIKDQKHNLSHMYSGSKLTDLKLTDSHIKIIKINRASSY